MKQNLIIDTTFDVRTDSGGYDPDQYSPTLKKYHKILWSKPLPNGVIFDLDDTKPGFYLQHKSKLGTFSLSSDSFMPTFSNWKRLSSLIPQIPRDKIEYFDYITYTIGGVIIFPCNKINGKSTINMERGFNNKIADRFDLTLECIRLHYLNLENPMFETLNRYKGFFSLFENFKNYVDFFLLNDLVSDDHSSIKFFSEFDNFSSVPYPRNKEDYTSFMKSSINFVNLRNKRIVNYISLNTFNKE